mmetsp:Transcript_30215/g.83101  ORF Transcript_30215/g.83101 Transcript_30215/m.83101 type:complete len:151 (+) Transcript_30215:96-548(+)
MGTALGADGLANRLTSLTKRPAAQWLTILGVGAGVFSAAALARRQRRALSNGSGNDGLGRSADYGKAAPRGARPMANSLPREPCEDDVRDHTAPRCDADGSGHGHDGNYVGEVHGEWQFLGGDTPCSPQGGDQLFFSLLEAYQHADSNGA